MSFKIVGVLEQEGIFHPLERTSLCFVEGYSSAMVTRKVDWSVLCAIDRATST